MEEITSEVRQIENNLHSSRLQLQTLEASAQKTISSEVDQIRESLKSGDNRVEHVTTQVRTFLSQIEYVDDVSTSVNMQPQMLWLRDNLQIIVSDLDAAKIKAESSIKCTEEYSYKVMDVGEEVDSASNKLTEYHSEAAQLEEQAKSLLRSNELMLEYTQKQIKLKEKEIKDKTGEVTLKQQSKAKLEAALATNQRQLAQAKRERQDRKEQAIASAGLGLLGILGAPFTGGASLALTVGAGGVAGYKASRMDDFEREATSYRSSINSVNTEISQTTREVETLEADKKRLQRLVSEHQSEVSTSRAQHHVHERKIKEANRVQGDISTLHDHAASTKKNIVEALPELYKIKQDLEQCSTLVKERSLDVSTSSGYLERFVTLIPSVGPNIKKRRDFGRQMLLMQQTSETLERIHAEMPGLLPSVEEVRFLDIKPWNSGDFSVVDVETPMPEICYF